ncbi:MAG TPA: family 16 glycoside hydrolase [Phycisphaerae bacterium]|nr:family 16 glycoside hydrolase [Phycisphaerae bacterium]
MDFLRWTRALRAGGRLAGALVLAAAAAGPGCAKVDEPRDRMLFGGKDLTGWQVLKEIYYDRAGKVYVQDGQLVLSAGDDLTGVRWAGEFPRDGFEISLEARRIRGDDFFCGMTFPIAGGHGTLIVGGWGGSVVGISNVDTYPADENDTTTCLEFERGRWYRIEVVVADGRLDVWIDHKKVIELETGGRKFDVWPQQEDARPFGITTWRTTGALRNIALRRR